MFVERSLCRKVSWLVVRNYQGFCKRLTRGDSLHMVSGRKGIGSRLAKSGSGKKSKAVVWYGGARR